MITHHGSRTSEVIDNDNTDDRKGKRTMKSIFVQKEKKYSHTKGKKQQIIIVEVKVTTSKRRRRRMRQITHSKQFDSKDN